MSKSIKVKFVYNALRNEWRDGNSGVGLCGWTSEEERDKTIAGGKKRLCEYWMKLVPGFSEDMLDLHFDTPARYDIGQPVPVVGLDGRLG